MAEGDSAEGHSRHDDDSQSASPAFHDLDDLAATKGADIFSHQVQDVRRGRVRESGRWRASRRTPHLRFLVRPKRVPHP